MPNAVRIDKYLWAVRLYKTRSLATEACKKGKVSVDDMPAKPSRTITSGDVIEVKKMPVLYSYRVIDPIEKRVGAKVATEYMEDHTPKEEMERKRNASLRPISLVGKGSVQESSPLYF